MLAIPYIAASGAVTAFKFRKLHTSEGAKYLAPAGEKLGVYNVGALLHYHDYVAVCEGELDTVMVAQAGIPAVGIPGTGGWRPHYGRLFDGIGRVYVIADNDNTKPDSNPGQEFARHVCEELPQALNIMLPAGMDASQFILEKGEHEFLALLGV